jgi:hypothetical protein
MGNVSGGKEIVEFVSSGGKTKGILSLDEFFPRIWPLDNPKKPSIMGEKVRRAYMTLTERTPMFRIPKFARNGICLRRTVYDKNSWIGL